MSQGPHLFVDQVTRIDVVDNIVRLELGVLRPGDMPDQNAPKDAVLDDQAALLNMPVAGFLTATHLFQQVIGQMVDKGLLTPKDLAKPEIAEKQPEAKASPKPEASDPVKKAAHSFAKKASKAKQN